MNWIAVFWLQLVVDPQTRSRVQSSIAVNWSSGPATVSWPSFPIPRWRSRPHAELDAKSQETGIAVRIGLHTGRVTVAHDDVAGLAVHIAARGDGRGRWPPDRRLPGRPADPYARIASTASATLVLAKLKGAKGRGSSTKCLGERVRTRLSGSHGSDAGELLGEAASPTRAASSARGRGATLARIVRSLVALAGSVVTSGPVMVPSGRTTWVRP